MKARMINSDEIQELKLWAQWLKQVKWFQAIQEINLETIKKAA